MGLGCGLDNSCTNVPVRAAKLKISFVSENKTPFSFVTICRVLPKTPFELILGRKTIKEFNLALLVPSHFFSDNVAEGIINTTHPLLLSAKPVTVSLVVRRTTEVKHIVGPNPAMDAILKRAVVNPVIGMVLFRRCEKPTRERQRWRKGGAVIGILV